MNMRIKFIAGAVAIIMVIGAGWLLFGKKDGQGHTRVSFTNFFGGQNAGNGETPPPPPSADAGAKTPPADDREVYLNPNGFSFIHPKSLTVEAFGEDKGDMVLVHDSTGAGSHKEFQIFLQPFDEQGPITAARIHKDLPKMLVENPQTVLIGSNKDIEALIFNSENDSIGRTREVWFVSGGFLVQVTGYPEGDAVIGPILDTWSFSG